MSWRGRTTASSLADVTAAVLVTERHPRPLIPLEGLRVLWNVCVIRRAGLSGEV